MLAIAIFLLLVIFLLLCFRSCAMTKYPCFTFYMKAKHKIFYNILIRFHMQSFLKLLLGASQTLSILNWSAGGAVQGVTSVLLVVVLILLPVLYAYCIYSKFKELYRPSVREQIGTLYLKLNIDRPVALAYSVMFFVRRIIFVTVMLSLAAFPHIQVQAFLLVSILYLCYLNGFGVLFEARFFSRMEVWNEVFFLYLCYHLVLQANLLEPGEIRIQVGWSLVCSSILMVALNFIIVIMIVIKALIQKVRVKLHERRVRKLMELKRHAMRRV